MGKLNIKKVALAGTPVAGLSALLDKENIGFNAVECVNWDSYPYKPQMKFRIAHTDDAILLNYQVEEATVRGKYGEDNGQVWTDSCVEFFVIPANDGYYYNIEATCIGTVLVGGGKDRHKREHAAQEVMSGIQRWASLGREPFAEREGGAWELSLIIPYSTFFKHDIKSLDGVEVKGNFYKCGDELKTPHFVSWNPIKTENPDFHRPEFFGDLRFE